VRSVEHRNASAPHVPWRNVASVPVQEWAWQLVFVLGCAAHAACGLRYSKYNVYIMQNQVRAPSRMSARTWFLAF
jgi:hypothetical protein